MPSLAMIYEIIGVDRASPAFRTAGTSAEASAKKINGVVKAIAGFAVVDLGVKLVKMAGDFEQSTNVLVTAAGEQQKNLGKIRDGILGIATSTGTAWKDVTDAVYIAEKANLRGADAINVVKAAAQGAREENAKLSTVTNAVTSVMASYGLKAKDAVAVTNEIKTAAGESKTTMEEFAGSLSTVLPFASAAHISFADVAGVLGTLTQHGTTANEATQEMANTIRNLVGPIGTARKEMAQFGIDSVDVAKNLGSDKRGLTGTIEYLSDTILKKMGPSGLVLLDTFNQSKQASQAAQTEFDALGPAAQKLAQAFEANKIGIKDYRAEARNLPGEQGALALQFLSTYTNAKGFQDVIKNGGPAAQTYSQALKVMLGGTNGLNTALQILGPNLGATQDRSRKVADSFKTAGANVSGWESTQKLFNVQFDKFKQTVAALGIRIGTILLPPLKALFKVLTDHPVILEAIAIGIGLMITKWIALKALGLIEFIAALGARLIGLGTAAATASGAAGLGKFAGAAGAARLILAEEAGGGLAGAATRTGSAVEGIGAKAAGTAAPIAGMGTAFSSAGLLAGGAVALGVAGIAYGIHQILTDGNNIKLPGLTDLATAIGKGGGIGGKPANVAVTNALRNQPTGNNRGESVFDFTSRLIGTIDTGPGAQARDPGSTLGKNYGLTLQGITNVIQHGTRPQLKGLIADLDEAARASHANGKTIQTLNDFYEGLFNRFNSARAALGPLVAGQQKNNQVMAETSTNAKDLSTRLGITADRAQGLAGVNKGYARSVANVNDVLQTNATFQSITTKGFDANSIAVGSNRTAMILGAEAALQHGKDIAALTGNVDLGNQAFRDQVGQLIDSAVHMGYSRDAANKLVDQLFGVKQNSDLKINVHADGTFNLQDLFGAQNAADKNARTHAVGHIVDYFARGGLRENHIAQIAPANTLRIWAEPETGGEAYIPLAQAKRSRSIDIWAETGRRLGVFADGGLSFSAFDAAFPPTMNAHVERLETAMNAQAQRWFTQRRAIDSMLFDAGRAGPGQSYPLIIDYMRQSGIGFTQADPGLGRGGHSYHEAGDAVDFSGGNLDAMAAYWHKVAFALLEEIHSPGFYVKNGKDVGGGFYGADVVAQHFNHVHVAAGLGAMQNLLGLAAGIGAAGGAGAVNTSGGSGAAKAYAQARLASMGEGDQFGALLQLWTMESGWNPYAVNPSSGAYGIPQSLGHGHPYNLGDYAAQVDWGLNYITERYGSPSVALNHEHQFSWYDAGGVLPHNGLAANTSGKPEMVLTNAQWAQFARFVKALETQEFIKYAKAIAAETAKLNAQFATYVQNEQQFRDTLKGNITQGNTFNDLIAHAGTPGDVKTLITGKITDIKAFVSKITALRKAGWPSALIRDIANDGIGPGTQYADVLLAASKSDKATLIGLSNSLSQTSTDAANWITSITGQTGLTVPSAVSALNQAIFTPGANAATLTNQAAKAQAAAEFNRPLMHIGTANFGSKAEVDLALQQAQFRQRAGTLT